jgi:flavin reductase (DIM6/NTAB) family NADH-FMN oxidoreductase RutF/DNA-binding MarR family transcriptional regulator
MPGAAMTAPVEEGDPARDPRAFRRCLGQFATGVTVMTGMGEEGPFGVTANSFSSLSLDPPLVLWSIARSSRSLNAFAAADRFAVNILGVEQVALSQLFSSPVDDRFAGLDWRPGSGGAPVLPGILALLECETEARHDGGDHLILVGRVRRYARYAGGALVYAQGRYAVAEDHPAQVRNAGAVAPAAPSLADLRLMSLMSCAASYASDAFDRYRQSEGVNLSQSRATFALGAGPAGIEDVLRRSDLSRPSAEDALASLAERGLVAADAGRYGLTASGRALLAKLAEQLDRFEAGLLEGVPAADVAAARRVLETLCRRLDPQT